MMKGAELCYFDLTFEEEQISIVFKKTVEIRIDVD